MNWNPFLNLVLSLVNTPVFQHFMGVLDGNGRATARFNAPALPGYAGLMMHFAYLLNDPYDCVSNPAAVEVVP